MKIGIVGSGMVGPASGGEGVLATIALPLDLAEQKAFARSARVLREAIESLGLTRTTNHSKPMRESA